MQRTLFGILGLMLLMAGLVFGLGYLVQGKEKGLPSMAQASGGGATGESTSESATAAAEEEEAKLHEIQKEIETLSSQLLADMQKEVHLNLGLVGQLRAYQSMLDQMQEYARKVEQDIDIIEEISKQEFQEDVQLQAGLFAGKKASLVASHLEEFRASRVGAILAHMKGKEASAVLDVWAKKKDPRVSAFYREVMAAYLSNKRYQANPELFQRSTN